jgi:broad specificity phosphatase PhoE
MKILFCRHGESHENVKGNLAKVVNDSPLTKKGLKQTSAFLQLFRKYGVQKVYYSPKERAKAIGKIIDRELKIPHETVSGLSERNWGIWGNKPWEEVAKKLEKLSIKQRYKIVPPKGESWKSFEIRLFKALKKIEKEAKEKGYNSIAVVTHRGCLRAIFPILLKSGIEEHKRFSVEVGSVSVISKDEERYVTEMFNHVPGSIFKRILNKIRKRKGEHH